MLKINNNHIFLFLFQVSILQIHIRIEELFLRVKISNDPNQISRARI